MEDTTDKDAEYKDEDYFDEMDVEPTAAEVVVKVGSHGEGTANIGATLGGGDQQTPSSSRRTRIKKNLRESSKEVEIEVVSSGSESVEELEPLKKRVKKEKKVKTSKKKAKSARHDLTFCGIYGCPYYGEHPGEKT